MSSVIAVLLMLGPWATAEDERLDAQNYACMSTRISGRIALDWTCWTTPLPSELGETQ